MALHVEYPIFKARNNVQETTITILRDFFNQYRQLSKFCEILH